MKNFLHLYLSVFMMFLGMISTAQDFNTYFSNGSLRFDYYHTGNAQMEMISNDEIFFEPNWGGSKLNLIDTFDYGNYKFEVYDSVSNTLIYSRGYATLFSEWRHTPEAKKGNRSFSESVIMPFPKKSIKIVFYARSKSQNWEQQYSVFVNPKAYYIIKQQNAQVKSFKISGDRTPDKALDIVLLSEGYTAQEMQKFMEDAQRFKNYLLYCEPFKSNATKINIWAVPTASVESGTDIPGKNIWKNTLFDSHFYTFGTERYINTVNNKMVRDYAANAPYDQIYILANTSKYGGAGIYNYYSICTSDNQYSNFVFVHEFGHAFAGLADEYYSSDVAVEEFYNKSAEPWEPNITTLVDFDKKWKSQLEEGTPIPTESKKEYDGKLGVFEGAGYSAKGIYRPRMECTMKSIKYDYFCPVCTKAIIDRINFYAK